MNSIGKSPANIGKFGKGHLNSNGEQLLGFIMVLLCGLLDFSKNSGLKSISLFQNACQNVVVFPGKKIGQLVRLRS